MVLAIRGTLVVKYIHMRNEYKTTRIWLRTLRNLKRVSAETGETIVALLDRLADQEWHRVRKDKDASQDK